MYIISTLCIVDHLIDQYNDRMLRSLRQFHFIPNRSGKFMDLLANWSTPFHNHFCWDLINTWWFVTFKLFNSQRTLRGSWIEKALGVVNSTPRPLYPRERPGTLCKGSFVGLMVVLDWSGKSQPQRDSIPGPFSTKRVAFSKITFYNFLIKIHSTLYFQCNEFYKFILRWLRIWKSEMWAMADVQCTAKCRYNC
jgi:hypothetical protein